MIITVRLYQAHSQTRLGPARQRWPYVKVQEMGSLCLLLTDSIHENFTLNIKEGHWNIH